MIGPRAHPSSSFSSFGTTWTPAFEISASSRNQRFPVAVKGRYKSHKQLRLQVSVAPNIRQGGPRCRNGCVLGVGVGGVTTIEDGDSVGFVRAPPPEKEVTGRRQPEGLEVGHGKRFNRGEIWRREPTGDRVTGARLPDEFWLAHKRAGGAMFTWVTVV